MKISEALKLGQELLLKHSEKHPLLKTEKWSIGVNKRKRAFGVCSYRNKKILLSQILVPAMTVEAVKDTINHEIAHALTKGHGHDNVWKSMCLSLGGNGQRCGGTDKYFEGAKGREEVLQTISKYTLTCPDPNCNCKSYRSRYPKRSVSCGMHGSRQYDPKYKMIVTTNY